MLQTLTWMECPLTDEWNNIFEEKKTIFDSDFQRFKNDDGA